MTVSSVLMPRGICSFEFVSFLSPSICLHLLLIVVVISRREGKGVESKGKDELQISPLTIVEDIKQRIDIEATEELRIPKLRRRFLRVIIWRLEWIPCDVVFRSVCTMIVSLAVVRYAMRRGRGSPNDEIAGEGEKLEGMKERHTFQHPAVGERSNNPHRESCGYSPNHCPFASLLNEIYQ